MKVTLWSVILKSHAIGDSWDLILTTEERSVAYGCQESNGPLNGSKLYTLPCPNLRVSRCRRMFVCHLQQVKLMMLEMSERGIFHFVEVAVSVIFRWYNLMIINSKYNTEKVIGCTSLMQSIFFNTRALSCSSNVWRPERKEQLLSLSRLASKNLLSICFTYAAVRQAASDKERKRYVQKC